MARTEIRRAAFKSSLLGHAYPGNKHWPAISRTPDMRFTHGLVFVGDGRHCPATAHDLAANDVSTDVAVIEAARTPCKSHQTPKHASWPKMVENEVGVLQRQCLSSASRTGERSKPRSRRGRSRGTKARHESTGCSRPKRPGTSWRNPTPNPTLPNHQSKSQNHCDKTLEVFRRALNVRFSRTVLVPFVFRQASSTC